VSEAAERGRSGGGPSLIEAMTERIVGHYIGDHEQYRTPGELERISADEPLARLTRHLPEPDVGAVRGRLSELISQASELALQAELADVDAVRDHLYAGRASNA
jgi:pyruvate dehydrogenase E1 component alpha subunit